MGRGGVVVVGDCEGGVEPFFEVELVLYLFLGPLAADEFLGVGIVPPGEADFGGRPVGMGAELRRRKHWELGLHCHSLH